MFVPSLPNTQPARNSRAAQEFLAIDSIRDGVVILTKNEGLRAVLMASALNFALKSEEEQDALTAQYENFLNSLDFPLQFVIQSRRLNIQPYLDTLSTRQQEETSELLKVQIGEYVEFVRSFVELSAIVTKMFYVVIPFSQTAAERQVSGATKWLAPFFGGAKASSASSSPEANGDSFAQQQMQLQQRVDAVSLGLRRLGLRVVPLGTDELVELFYGLYNPSESQRAAGA